MRTTAVALLVVALTAGMICGAVYGDKKSKSVVRVENENGKNVANAEVILVPFEPPGPTIYGNSGKNGKAVFEGLKPNTLYHIFVFAPDGTQAVVWMWTDANGEGSVTATVK